MNVEQTSVADLLLLSLCLSGLALSAALVCLGVFLTIIPAPDRDPVLGALVSVGGATMGWGIMTVFPTKELFIGALTLCN